jgi:hypothetical protein
MRLFARVWIVVFALAGLLTPTFASSTQAQSDAATPPAADVSASPTPSDTIWFVIAPEGKANGDFFDVKLDAGESATLKVTLGNGSAIPVQALVYAADAVSGVNGGFVMNGSDDPVTAPTTWLDFPTETVDFDAQEATERSFTVTVPEGTPPGQYITGIAVETANASPMEGDAPIMVKYRLAAAVLITVPGPVEPSFQIGTISAAVDEQTTTIDGIIENTGNIRVRPEGTLTVTDASGKDVVTAQISMGSVYAGDTTTFQVNLPTPLPEGEYTVSTSLEDPDTKATAEVSDVALTVAKPEAPAPVTVSSFEVAPMPSADNVVFAQVSVTLSNTGTPLAGGELTLDVFQDGEQVASQVLGSSLTLQNGDTVVEQPYIPTSGTWESGTYTFQVTLSATDPATGTEATILTAESDAEIVIP